MRILMGVMILLAAGAAEASRGWCTQHADFIRRVRANEIGIQELVSQATQHDVIFIGESHIEQGSALSESAYRTFFSQVKKARPAFSCVAIEATEATREVWSDIERAAEANAMQVYLAEEGSNCFESNEPIHSKSSLQCRNDFVAAKIQQLIDSGTCDAIVAINGSYHLTTDFGWAKDAISVPRLLEERAQRTSYVMNFIFTEHDGRNNSFLIEMSWYWNFEPLKCDIPKHRASRNGNFYLIPKGIDHPLSIETWYGNTDLRGAGRWSDFDAVALFGTEE